MRILFGFAFVHYLAIFFILVVLVILVVLLVIRAIIVDDLGLVQESLFIFIDLRVLFVLLIGLLDTALAELIQSQASADIRVSLASLRAI